MKHLVVIFLLYAVILTEACINRQSDLEQSLINSLHMRVDNETEDQTLLMKEAKSAFVPDLYNASSFLVPRLVYILITCNSLENVQDVIDGERAYVWTSQYLFVYMHPAVISLVSLFDVTSLGLSVHTLRLCVPDTCTCTNATKEVNFKQAILKVSDYRSLTHTRRLYYHKPRGCHFDCPVKC